MIGRLSGQLLAKQPPWIVIDVHGVGYELETSMNTLVALPAVGESVSLFTHLTIRDDAHLLYGFGREHERALFRALIKVNGVGPKLALAILSGMDEDAFMRCVRDDDSKALTTLPGVGKKTAERLVIEMSDRLDKIDGGPVSLPGRVDTRQPDDARSDAIAALEALGYRNKDAAAAVAKAADEDGLSSEQLIRKALKSLAR